MKIIMKRVNYYNRLNIPIILPADSPTLSQHRFTHEGKVYFFDTYEYIRWFKPQLHWLFFPGDITHIPPSPAIVKSRPIGENNSYSILLNLDKVRHFLFVNDAKSFTEKENKVVFMGKVAGKANRISLMEQYFNNPSCLMGDVSSNPNYAHWHRAKFTIKEHLKYKFILAIEGNDVASNLKWVMSSNSIAVMPPPTYETWFMEGILQPNVHYIAIKPDFSDLIERIEYYAAHPDQAQLIINNAHTFIDQFRNRHSEKLISLLVLEKYFNLTSI